MRAHVEAKAAGLPLIIGSHFRLTAGDGSPALAFTALAMNREGYGNLCELITLGRTRAAKGTYRLAPMDLEHPEASLEHLRGLPDCMIILTPDFPANEQRLDAQLEWAARVFGDRARVALTLHARAMDDIHRGVATMGTGGCADRRGASARRSRLASGKPLRLFASTRLDDRAMQHQRRMENPTVEGATHLRPF